MVSNRFCIEYIILFRDSMNYERYIPSNNWLIDELLTMVQLLSPTCYPLEKKIYLIEEQLNVVDDPLIWCIISLITGWLNFQVSTLLWRSSPLITLWTRLTNWRNSGNFATMSSAPNFHSLIVRLSLCSADAERSAKKDGFISRFTC